MSGDRTRDRIVEFVSAFRAEHEVSPTIREIARGCGVNISTTHRYVNILVASGRLRWAPGVTQPSPRTILPNPQPQQETP